MFCVCVLNCQPMRTRKYQVLVEICFCPDKIFWYNWWLVREQGLVEVCSRLIHWDCFESEGRWCLTTVHVTETMRLLEWGPAGLFQEISAIPCTTSLKNGDLQHSRLQWIGSISRGRYRAQPSVKNQPETGQPVGREATVAPGGRLYAIPHRPVSDGDQDRFSPFHSVRKWERVLKLTSGIDIFNGCPVFTLILFDSVRKRYHSYLRICY